MSTENEEIKKIFLKYLEREPTTDEYEYHAKDFAKNPALFERKVQECDERRSLMQSPKTAVLVSGHPRNLKFLKDFVDHRIYLKNVDLFIFSWDQWGSWGEETDLESASVADQIEEIIKNVPRVKKYKIESNKKWIEENPVDENIAFFRFSRVPEVFIKSQLYAISESFKLMESHMKETGAKYDVVLKTRFELGIQNFEVEQLKLDELKNSKLIFVPDAKDSAHAHPHPSYCVPCDIIYKKLNLCEVHIFEHANPICDLYAYGGYESMKKYCSLYFQYEKLCKKFEKSNIDLMNKINTPHKMDGNVYELPLAGHIEEYAIQFFFCSYPERVFSYYLKDYLLPRAEKIVLKWNFNR